MAEKFAAAGYAVRLGGRMGGSNALSQDRSLPFSFPAIMSISRIKFDDSMSVRNNTRRQMFGMGVRGTFEEIMRD